MVTSTCTQDGNPMTDQLAGKPTAAVENGAGPHPTLLFVNVSDTSAVVTPLHSLITIGATTRLGGTNVQGPGFFDGDGVAECEGPQLAVTKGPLVADCSDDARLFTLNTAPVRSAVGWFGGITTDTTTLAVSPDARIGCHDPVGNENSFSSLDANCPPVAMTTLFILTVYEP
jgi:hypothetical protein